MNIQEVIRKMHEAGVNCKAIKYASQFDKGYNNGIAYAINLLDKLDEPEKPVLSKEEAEWVDKLTDVYDVSDALYYITRCGYGYDLTFEICGKTYELPLEDGITYGELYKLKERLVNAVLYGYEVRKEKLYTVELPNSNNFEHLMLQKDRRGKISVAWYCTDSWREDERVRLTESEIKKDFDWAWQFAEEVEE